MEKEFVNYNQVLKLKPLGFDEPCFGYYVLERNGDYKLYDKCEVKTYFTYIEAPTFSQAFRWFREKYDYIGFIYQPNETGYWAYSLEDKAKYDTYEEAELACLDKLIEIVEQKNEKTL